MKKIIVASFILALCLLSFAVAASADKGNDNNDNDHDQDHDQDHDHDHDNDHGGDDHDHDNNDRNCRNWNQYDICFAYVKRGYYGSFPKYNSGCCRKIRDANPYCLCYYFRYQRKDCDWKRYKQLCNHCGKDRAKFDCCNSHAITCSREDRPPNPLSLETRELGQQQ
ncbi:hypothetical protein R1sor_000346 [Riccia sorocarpa]|uniref:Bifunctional inhibitor/plant lipid transfer protein/seed storage helical domain-containing protein n=1 Tax=Riccia sorocarpa TaxID=122646 RepID=A0ABD3GYV1_9MARC